MEAQDIEGDLRQHLRREQGHPDACEKGESGVAPRGEGEGEECVADGIPHHAATAAEPEDGVPVHEEVRAAADESCAEDRQRERSRRADEDLEGEGVEEECSEGRERESEERPQDSERVHDRPEVRGRVLVEVDRLDRRFHEWNALRRGLHEDDEFEVEPLARETGEPVEEPSGMPAQTRLGVPQARAGHHPEQEP